MRDEILRTNSSLSEDDYNNGIDHYIDCENPLNCDCDNLIHCPICHGFGFLDVDAFSLHDKCSNCEEGVVLKSE